jgi:hypothetical protein
VRKRLIVGMALMLAGWAVADRWNGPVAAPPEALPPAPPAIGPSPEPTVDPPESSPARDLFRYADEPSAEPVSPRARVVTPPTAAPTPVAEAPVRLVGLVRQSGGLRAAVAIRGEVVLLKPGESADGWTLVALDEDAVRLRGPDGHETVLAASE